MCRHLGLFLSTVCCAIIQFSLHWPSGPIKSISCSVREPCVPSLKARFMVEWRLLVEERIANINMPLKHVEIDQDFFVFANKPAVHIEGLSRGRSMAVVVGVSD